jgi:mannose-1-phosphate guanylyltransferase/phosphomannomutase
MVNQSELFDQIAARHGAAIRRTAIDPQALMSAVADAEVILAFSAAGEFVVPSFHKLIDAMYPIAKLLEYLARYHTTLDDVAANLPPAYTATARVDCPWEKKGTVMRLLNEQMKDQIVEQVDGVKIRLGDGEWVLFIPEPDQPLFTIYTESKSHVDADALAKRYARVIQEMQA